MLTRECIVTRSNLTDISRALAGAPSSEERILLAVEGIRELFHADLCTVYLRDEENPHTVNVIRQGRNSGPEYDAVMFDAAPSSEQYMTDLLEKLQFVQGGLEKDDEHRCVFVPLEVGKDAVGALELSGCDPGRIEEGKLALDLLVPLLAFSIHSGRELRGQSIENADLEARCWEMRRERSKVSSLFNSLPFPFYCIDRDFRLVAVNEMAADRGDCEPDRMLGMRCYETMYRRQEPCPGCRVGESLTSGIMTFRHGRKWQEDGDPREWEISTYPLRDDHGRVVEAVVLEQDITEKNRLVESLARTAKLAAVEQLAAGVAHEINNPLVAIIANSQLLQREIDPGDNRSESINLIARAGDRALGVVRALLDLTQQETYTFNLIDINQSIRSAVQLVKHQLVGGAVELNLFLSPELPLIQASEDHLQGMWLNLLFNARDALTENRGRITITSEQQGNYIVVTVQDDGVGIPEDRLSRVFEPFYTTKDPGDGTGLGLSVCHRIVRQHGGKIQVQSEQGRGTEFIVSLPVVT